MFAMTVLVNGEEHQLATDISLAQLVAELAAGAVTRSDDGKVCGVAIAVNESVVARGSWASTPIHDGDHIEILKAVQGG